METVLDQLVTARTAERRERALARARLALAELGRRGVRAGIIGSLERIMDDIGFALPALRRSSRRAGRCRQHAADRRSQRKNRSAFAARLLRAAASRSEQMLALQCSERRVLSWVRLCGRRVASAPFLPAPPDPRAAARKSAAARSRRPRAAGQAGRLPCLGRKCAWLALPSSGGRLRRVFAHGSIRCSARRCKAEGRVALAAGPAGARAPGASLRA